jgi:hypothetical protein
MPFLSVSPAISAVYRRMKYTQWLSRPIDVWRRSTTAQSWLNVHTHVSYCTPSTTWTLIPKQTKRTEHCHIVITTFLSSIFDTLSVLRCRCENQVYLHMPFLPHGWQQKHGVPWIIKQMEFNKAKPTTGRHSSYSSINENCALSRYWVVVGSGTHISHLQAASFFRVHSCEWQELVTAATTAVSTRVCGGSNCLGTSTQLPHPTPTSSPRKKHRMLPSSRR